MRNIIWNRVSLLNNGGFMLQSRKRKHPDFTDDSMERDLKKAVKHGSQLTTEKSKNTMYCTFGLSFVC